MTQMAFTLFRFEVKAMSPESGSAFPVRCSRDDADVLDVSVLWVLTRDVARLLPFSIPFGAADVATCGVRCGCLVTGPTTLPACSVAAMTSVMTSMSASVDGTAI
jgi:hypothetical protein